MKGIILAGGSGTRMRPVTKVTSKQLLPVYDKPMIFYPLETLITAGIRDILIIIAPENAGDFLKLLGSGKEFGCNFSYEIQDEPRGLADAFLVGESFIGDESVTMILGDNIFEDDFTDAIQSFESGGRIFAKEVPDPERFGIVEFDENNTVLSIEEKPAKPKSNFCIPGLYIYDKTVVAKAKQVTPSARGEIEITSLHTMYLKEGTLDVRHVTGAWFDTGTFESWFAANAFMRERALQKK